MRQALRPLADEHRPVGESEVPAPLALVALSGGADSLALALALAYEAPKLGLRAGAVIVDHGLQAGSALVAERAATQARQMGLDPVLIESVQVAGGTAGDGPEGAARAARYAAFARVAEATGAWMVLTAHTHDDQAEQVLLALARGSGLRSLAGIPAQRVLTEAVVSETVVAETVVSEAVVSETVVAGGKTAAPTRYLLRPFLAQGAKAGSPVITRAITEAACADQGVDFWRDPHNLDHAYARVRVRQRVLPLMEAELGPGIADALVRTAELAREDADALDEMAREYARGLLGGRSYLTVLGDDGVLTGDEALHVATGQPGQGREELLIAVHELSGLARPVLYRVIRVLSQLKFDAYLERVHTLAIAELVTSWRGQGTVYVPGIAVTRRAGQLSFERQTGSPRG